MINKLTSFGLEKLLPLVYDSKVRKSGSALFLAVLAARLHLISVEHKHGLEEVGRWSILPAMSFISYVG
jgi:hypothetical protein